jgi:hypothetical protein
VQSGNCGRLRHAGEKIGGAEAPEFQEAIEAGRYKPGAIGRERDSRDSFGRRVPIRGSKRGRRGRGGGVFSRSPDRDLAFVRSCGDDGAIAIGCERGYGVVMELRAGDAVAQFRFPGGDGAVVVTGDEKTAGGGGGGQARSGDGDM